MPKHPYVSLILYINGDVADLAPGTVIAQTRQVNDLNSLNNRQASYTNKFNLPKTAHNVRLFNHLSFAGNTSNIPYQKNECSLYSSSGECFVYNGWAVLSDGGDTYEAVIYDGIIDLYKEIENKNLSELGLTDITHDKTFNNIKDSWDTPLNYTYILADYNGDNTVNNPASTGLSANLDYLVPAVRVSYLWQRIFDKYNFGRSGSIFDSDDFKSLWLTLPKGIPNIQEQNTLVYEGRTPSAYPANTIPSLRFIMNVGENAVETQDYVTLQQGSQESGSVSKKHIRIQQSGRYKLELTGQIKAHVNTYYASNLPSAATMYICKNDQFTPLVNLRPWKLIQDRQPPEQPIIFMEEMNLEAGDTLCFLILSPNQPPGDFYLEPLTIFDIKLTHVTYSSMDFNEAFTDFPIRDFLTEIVQRFGLTMYRRKYEKHYDFLTLAESLEQSPMEDWSKKFVRKKNEEYITGDYAQQNWFRYLYNDKEQSHNDGYLTVANTNLPDSTNLYTSRIYSPERAKTTYLNRETNVYRLWDKEVVENPGENQPPIKYKALDKRYYLIRGDLKETGIYLQSNANSIQSGQCSKYYLEKYDGLPFYSIIDTYYAPLRRVLQNALVITAELWLSEADVANFDFKKRYYFEQLGGSFIMNKITNYIPGKTAACELLRVQ